MISSKQYQQFKKILFFHPKAIRIFLLFSIFSAIITVLFPVITQTYLHYLYPQKSIKPIIIITFGLIIFFFFKLIIDIRLRKYEQKYFLKLEKHIKEYFFNSWKKTKKKESVKRLHYLFEVITSRYLLFVKKVLLYNFLSLTKIIALIMLMFFFNKKMLLYSLWFIPVFVIYSVFFYSIMKKNKNSLRDFYNGGKNKEQHLVSVLEKMSLTPDDSSIEKEFRRATAISLEKEILKRNSLIGLNTTLESSISFYRILFLAYFGVIIVMHDGYIGNLIVGLLYITILARNCNNILESLLFYFIGKKAVSTVHHQMEKSISTSSVRS